MRDLLALGCDVTVVSRGGRAGEAALTAGASRVVDSIGALPADVRALSSAPRRARTPTCSTSSSRPGCPLYVEKPLTDDPASARRLAEAAPERLFVMDKWRYHPGVELLRDLARSGALGRVVGLRSVRVGWGNPHGDVDGIWMLSPHDLSIALEILGELPEPRAAVAERLGSRVTGIVGVLGSEPWFVLESSTAHPLRRREIRLVGEEGVAVLPDPYSDHVLVARGEVHDSVTLEEERLPISSELPLLRELRAFVEHLDGGPPPRSSAAEGAATVAAIARLRELAGLDGPA